MILLFACWVYINKLLPRVFSTLIRSSSFLMLFLMGDVLYFLFFFFMYLYLCIFIRQSISIYVCYSRNVFRLFMLLFDIFQFKKM